MFKRLLVCGLCCLILSACGSAPRTRLVVEEHLLSGPPDISTDQLVFHFAQGGQEAILAKTAAYRDYLAQWKEYNTRALEPFGYELKFHPEAAGSTGYSSVDIYKGDQPIARDAVTIHPVSLNASETQFLAVVEMPDGAYTLTRGGFEPRPFSLEKQPYGYAGDQLLSLEVRGALSGQASVSVYLDDQPAYATEFNDVSVYGPFDGPYTYGKHWALVIIDARPDGQGGWLPFGRLIQDGQDLTEAKGYQQAFQFAVLDGRPFYFYQKDDKIGISYDGKEIATGYDEVPHYQCCSGSLLNPRVSMKMAWFFARRGSDWYYVEAYMPGAMPQ